MTNPPTLREALEKLVAAIDDGRDLSFETNELIDAVRNARAALSAQVPEDDAGLVERLRAGHRSLRLCQGLCSEFGGYDTLRQAADRIEALGSPVRS